jgi:hypothetical protein
MNVDKLSAEAVTSILERFSQTSLQFESMLAFPLKVYAPRILRL